MDRTAWVPTELRVTILFAFLGLTAWYLAVKFSATSVVQFVALFGLGVVVPLLVNGARRRSSNS